MILQVLVFIIVLIIQFVLALFSKIARYKLEKKYNHPLSNMVEASAALENYVKIYRRVNIKVHAKIPFPAFAKEEFIIINRDRIYKNDLFTNFYTLYQLELSRKENNLARKLYTFQNFIFFLQLLFFILGSLQFDVSYIFLVISIGIQLFAIFFSIIGFIIYEFILGDALEVSKDLLGLDEVEIARTESLKNDLKLHVFEYPFEFLRRLFSFISPV